MTHEEKYLLNNIGTNTHISKKYNFTDEITIQDEIDLFKIYLPNEQTDNYNDYYNSNNQNVFYTKRINYEKTKKNIKTIDKILDKPCNTITDFKLSAIDKKNKISNLPLLFLRWVEVLIAY